MQDTRQILEAMDGDAFERLVVRCLSEMFSELRGLAVLGQNDDGKPIPCPVDGLYFVAAPEPYWVMVASTTMARQKLRGKWLGNAGKAGDVDKAVTWFNAAKAKSSGVKGRLILATNRSLGGNDKLYLDAVSEGMNSGLQMQIIEGSALVRFLDNTREGQSVRQEILNIPASLISLPLLRQVARESLKAHWQRYGPGWEKADHLILREAQADIRRGMAAGSSLIGLQGASGLGKSVLAHQVARERTEAGDLAIWLPAELIAPDAPLATTLSAVLKMFSASLGTSAGEDALRLIADQASHLIFLVDDINRTGRPAQLVRAMNGWIGGQSYQKDPLGRAQKAGQVSGSSPQVRFLVPLWPNAVAPSHAGTEADKTLWAQWHLIPVEEYSKKEQKLLEEQRRAEHIYDFERIASVLGGDPFLCGLVMPQFRLTSGLSRTELIQHIVEEFLAQAALAAKERAKSFNVLILSHEVVQAVDALIDLMIDEDEPEPDWMRVQSRLSERQSDILRHVADTNQLGWLISDTQQAVWHWKHTRLRDALIGRRLAMALLPEIVDKTKPPVLSDRVERLLANPGLCEIWAVSLVFLPSAEAQSAAIKILGQHAPLALAHALRLSLFPEEAAQREALHMGLKTMLVAQPERTNEFVPSPQTLILEQLSLTDDELVLDIVDGIPGAWDVDFARLRNGDAVVALGMIERALRQGGFPPAVKDRQLEAALEAFGKREVRQSKQLVEHMEAALQDGGLIEAAVFLMGYLAWPEFSALICDSWQQLRSLLFPLAGYTNYRPWLCYLWASGRCCTPNARPVLAELLRGVERLDSERREHGATQRYLRFGSSMKQAIRFPLSPSAVETWLEVAAEMPTIRRDLLFVCRHQEEPDIIEAYVRYIATAESVLSEFMENVDVLHDPQPLPSGWSVESKTYQSEAVLRRLWDMVKQETDEKIRALAFTIWKRSASHEELNLLRSINESDILFDASLKVRVRLTDETAAPALAGRIRQRPAYWCGYAPLLYHNAEVQEAFLENYPAALDEAGWDANNAIGYLPLDAIPQFVSRLRPSLLRASRTWVPLLLTGVPEALALVREAVSQASILDLQMLFHFDLYPSGVLTKKMLEAIEPVLSRCEQNDLVHLVEKAINDGQSSWVLDHLPEIVTGEGHEPYWLTEPDIRASLDELARRVPQGFLEVRRTSGFYDVADSRKYRALFVDSMTVLRAWLGEMPSDDQITVAALVVSEKGIPADFLWWSKLRPGDIGRSHWENASMLLRIRRWKN